MEQRSGEVATSFHNLHRRLLRYVDPGYRHASASHAWIALHRLVEAHCRGAGARFVDVFAELERRFDFRREDPARWPDPPAMRAAAAWLSARRGEVLATRARLAAEQKRLKRAGARARVSPELAALEARVRTFARPRVGPWGWRRLRMERA